MSLFGSPPSEETAVSSTPSNDLRSAGGGLFDEPSDNAQHSNGLFDGDDGDSPWSMPTSRKQQSRAEIVRNLLPGDEVPESYIETFETIRREGDKNGINSDGVHLVFAAARLHDPATQERIVSLVAPDGLDGDDKYLGRDEFNVLLALVGLAQEGEVISLDGVDERRRNLPSPKLAGLTAEPILPPIGELAAKPPQTPMKDHHPSPSSQRPSPSQTHSHSSPRPKMDARTQSHQQQQSQNRIMRPPIADPEDDPWNTPDLHKHHNHPPINPNPQIPNGQNGFHNETAPTPGERTLSQYTTQTSGLADVQQNSASAPGSAGWGYFDGSAPNVGAPFSAPPQEPVTSPFGGIGGGNGIPGRAPGHNPIMNTGRTINGGRAGAGVEEHVVVSLLPEKEGIFMFQHHNYEVASQRRGSKAVRRYSDFVWLLDCLHKRYPFRVLPLLPPKRVAVNGNHLSNDGGFIEKRRRGLARFLNALVRHPILSQEQLVVMFLTVPTELAVWRKQATISIQDEFSDKPLPPGLEESLPSSLEELFARTRAGVKRSADLYIHLCTIMDRLAKRQEGMAADHARVAMSLESLTGASNDTYATDDSEVPLLNDGLVAMSKHLRMAQALMEDEGKGWEQGVLEDLKRQRDALVSMREMFERRDRLDKDNIPHLERRIQANESKLTSLRAKPEGTVKAGEIERIAESIIKDKESIVQQHNRAIFVKECIRDELITFQSTQYHVSRWNQDWAGERVKYAEMLADNWRRLLEELEGMPLGE